MRGLTFEAVATHTICPELVPPAPRVVDLGAHEGDFSATMARRFGARCLAVEPMPGPRLERLEDEGVRLVRAAAGGADGEAEFFLGHHPMTNALRRNPLFDYRGSSRVRVVSISTLLGEAGVGRVDVLKMDIEGAELEVLAGAPDRLLEEVGQITVEFHEWAGAYDRREVLGVRRRLRDLGFVSASLCRGSFLDVLFVNRRLVGRWEFDRLVARTWTKRGLASLARRAGRMLGKDRAGA